MTLVVGLNHAVEDGLIAANPALGVRRLPSAHIEREFLRLEEIPRYLDACSGVHRRLAELLIGSGLRISEALGLRVGDLELEATRGTIVVYRSRNNESVGLTKSDRFRSVQIGPGRCRVLRDQAARRSELSSGDGNAAFLFVKPIRGAKRSNGRCSSASVYQPTAWLAAGNSLMYVQPQLGHADTSTTEHYYGHLERHVVGAGALATEDAITRAAVRQR